MSDSTGAPGGPGPRQLPGIEGFYLLTANGELGRYESDGRFAAEPDLTKGLADKIRLLLDQYRAGKGDDAAMALVVPNTPDKTWRSASFVLSDNALHEFFRTSNDPDAPLTAFQKRNKTKSIFQGMEVLLDADDALQPPYPRCCPVLFAPEADAGMLCRRYGIDTVDPVAVLEVLDLMAPLAPDEKKHPYLSRMVMDMQRTRIAPEMRSGPELVLAASEAESAPAPTGPVPWPDEPEKRELSSFDQGDPVTYWLLGWFAPFNELNDLQRQFIARGHKVTKVKAGATLVQRGSLDDVTIYLIEGTVELEAFDGKKIHIVGGTRRATLPISQLRPHAYTVKAETDATVILVSQKMVRDVTRITTTYRNRPGIEVSELASLPDNVPR